MNKKLLVLPTLCLGGAALLLAPSRPSQAFSKIGGSLGETQRDVRVFDNFADATANDNAEASPQFPGWTGVELATWKAVVEWGSLLHGDGAGDPLNSNTLGSGGANFDAFWAGNADGTGSTNQNVVSAQAICGGGGTLAYCETPIHDGWRIRVCDEWTWDDGPGAVAMRFDLQGVLAHEYGHALGLGHSGNGQATMAPSVSAGSTGLRSIHADDAAGIQCIYGLASITKPVITATVASAGTLRIHGSEFDGAANEVWFTSATATAAGSDPIVRVEGVPASFNGALLTLKIPPGAGPGDVLVNKGGVGGATLSNAFPTDLVGTFGIPPIPHPDITAITPSTIEALIPGTARTIAITGTNLDRASELLLDGGALAPSRYALVDAQTIALDMPEVGALGTHELAVTDGTWTDALEIEVVAAAGPRFQLGSGDALAPVDRDAGLALVLAGVPGRRHRLYVSLSDLPSTNPALQLALGNQFSSLLAGGEYVIPTSGWLRIDVPPALLPDPGPLGTVFFAQTVELRLPRPFATSALQSIRLVQ